MYASWINDHSWRLQVAELEAPCSISGNRDFDSSL